LVWSFSGDVGNESLERVETFMGPVESLARRFTERELGLGLEDGAEDEVDDSSAD